MNRAVSPVRLAGNRPYLGAPDARKTATPWDGRGGMFPTVSCHMEKSP